MPSTRTARAFTLAITPLLPLVCLARGDDPGDPAALGEGDVEDSPIDVGEHVIAGFAVVFSRIPCNFPSGVRKTHDNIGEVDTALNDVLRAFGRVPVELHDSI